MIFVVGHKNPDTDAIASALGYAWVKRERDGVEAAAARAGAPNAQTAFALKRFGVEAPPLLDDASPRFGAIAQTVRPLMPSQPLSAAWRKHSETERAAPVVDVDGTPIGLITGKSVFDYLSMRLDMADIPFRELISVSCQHACDTNAPRFARTDRVSDQRARMSHTQRDDFIVVDGDGRYVGICTRADVLRPPRTQLILVDHNEPSQAVSGLDESDVLEVIDHHRLNTIGTTAPISFTVDTVGSTSTLVAERAREARLTPPPGIAGMLLSGILSDTLVFKSPTTTARDKAVATWLTWVAFGVVGAGSALAEYGEQLLRAGSDLTGRSATDIVSGDFKAFEGGGVKFGVSQVEVTNFNALEDRIEEIRTALRALGERRGLDFVALMVTDIVENDSLLLAAGDIRKLASMPHKQRQSALWEMPGVVSRKKQLLPTLLGLLEG